MKAIKFFAVAILFSGVSVMASAQVNNITSSSAEASSSANIINPIKIVQESDLTFGTIATSATVGTVIIAADAVANPTATGGVALVPTTLIQRHAAKFIITGEPTYAYSIALADQDGTADVANLAGPGATMKVDLKNGRLASGNVLAAGDNELFIGGTLNVASGQLSGAYQGTFKVTVAYE